MQRLPYTGPKLAAIIIATMSRELTNALWNKVAEQVDLIDRLISLAPSSKLDWSPRPEESFDRHASAPEPGQQGEQENRALLSLGHLLGHLLDCLAGFCAAIYKIDPVRFEEMIELRGLLVNFRAEPEEARARIKQYSTRLRKAFGKLDDDDLAQPLPTIFVPLGEPALTVLLGNLEHLINHKFQLFMYLRLLGFEVSTRDLYRIRGE
ncbi:MAG TPA: DinB family protein [Blastocatellia bacterium]